MTLHLVLDTSVVAEPAMRDPDGEIVKRIKKRATQCGIPAPVWAELLMALESLPAGDERRAVFDRYLHDVVRPSFPILPYDDAAASWYARDAARRKHAGQARSVAAGQIAAIAVTQGLTLVTLRPKEYAGYRGLRVESWVTSGRA
jgi:tRNA(fMet)-specific endonuclease VapC